MKFVDILDDLIKEKDEKSLTNLGAKIGMNHGKLSNYLHGTLPSPKNAIKLANYFKCSLNYLFGLDDYFKEIEKERKLDSKGFCPKYEKLLKDNKTNHGELSRNIDINKTSFSRWRKGGLPSMKAIIEIANYFGESIDYLICE